MRMRDWSPDVCSSYLEQEQEERAFGPGTQSAGTGRRDEHQRVDFEAFQPQILDGLAQREPAAEQISDEIADERNPRRGRGQFFDRKSGCERSAANQIGRAPV